MNYLKVCIFLLAGCATMASAQTQRTNLSYVDPTIGGVGIILEPTRPTVHLPNSMLRVYPMKKDQLDDRISCFPLNVASHRIAYTFSFLPLSGKKNDLWGKGVIVEKEVTQPHYYKVIGEDDGTSIEFTPAERSGMFQVNFKGNAKNYLRFGHLNEGGVLNAEGKRVITGTERFGSVNTYFYAELNADVADITYEYPNNKGQLLAEVSSANKSVKVKYGISYISYAQAKANLYKEIPAFDFGALKLRAQKIWENALAKINIEGGTLAQKRVFYTSLYRAYERMVDVSEYGQYYSAFDNKVHQSTEPFFVDNWIWDNYIALEPLHMILNPKQETEKIRSYIKMYEQSGWMPSFAVTFGDWPAMTGNHAAAWMADAWFKGLRDFDIKKAYEGLKKNSLEATLIPWRNGPLTSLDSFYHAKGYMPALHPGEVETVKEVEPVWERRQAVSVTLEHSYDDWNIAQLSTAAGSGQDKQFFLEKSGNYKKVFRVEKGILWPKDKNGNWIEPYDPKLSGREYFTENNAYTFNWHVKHDLKGLFSLMGGLKSAEAKLDQLFREDLGTTKFKFWNNQPDASGLVGQFVMGNEPSFHIPYLYNYMGAPWKTQKRIRMLMDTWYSDNLFGMPGDEDGGGTTAFIVFSMMGFFPVTPGIPVYNIGSPVFNKITMKLPSGKSFTVEAKNNSAENKYIQSATLNGKVITKPWFTHAELLKGGTLTLVMGDQANKTWGSAADAAPPSNVNMNPGAFQ